MNGSETQWIWNAGSAAWISGGLIFLLYAALTVRNFRRHVFSGQRLLTEVFKFAGAVLLLLTLGQPELHRRVTRVETPRVAVIVDETDSMTTRDVEEDGEMLTRSEWVRELQESQGWMEVRERVRMDVLRMGHDDNPVYRETNLAAALASAREIDSLSAVWVISDGLHNARTPVLPEMLRLAEAGIKGYAVEVGSQERLPDLVLEDVRFPSYSLLNEGVVIPFRVLNTLGREAGTTARLLVNGREVSSTQMDLRSHGRTEGSLRWVPREKGTARLSVQVDVHPEEVFEDNNREDAEIEVRRGLIRVLVVESTPRWEVRYLRNALYRDPGVEVDTLWFHPGLDTQSGEGMLEAFPEDLETLAEYDVVFLGDAGVAPEQLKEEDARNLDLFVREQGGGLIFLPGPRGGQYDLLGTALDSLLPVEFMPDRRSGESSEVDMRMELTREGREHFLTLLDSSPARSQRIWRQLPGFNWYASVQRPRVGSEVLATHASRRNEGGRIPLLVTRTSGTGHVLFMGTDAAWRWRSGVEDLFHYRFWGQVVRWMAHRRNMFSHDNARIFLNPERPVAGREVTMTLVLRGVPDTAGPAPFEARIRDAEDRVRTLPVNAMEGAGTFRSRWTPAHPGTVTLELWTDGDAPGPWLEQEIEVEGVIPEQVGEPMDPALLRDLAQVTGGRSLSMEDVDKVLDDLVNLPREQVSLTVQRPWQHPIWITAVFACFACCWILRKRQGWI